MDKVVVSKLADVDPTFVQVVKSLYGEDADPRQIWDLTKSIPDQSSISSPGAQQKKRKTIAGGLLLGTAAEGSATAAAAKKAFNFKPVTPKIPESIAAVGDAGKAGTALKAIKGSLGNPKAHFALQATNLGVGLAAAHELLKKPKQPQAPKQPKTIFGKGANAKQLRAIAYMKGLPEDEKLARNLKTAQRSQKVIGGGAIAAGGVGGYKAGKKYGLRLQSPVTAATPITPKSAKAMNVKKNNELDFTWEGTISKVDKDKQLVFGWCSLSKVNGEPVVDLQGDYIPIEETETSAYKYVIESRKGGDMHRRVSKFDQDAPLHTADLVESVVFTPEKLQKMGLAPDALPHGWWIGMKVNDEEQWAAVKAGQRLGFSIHGKGRRVEKSLD